MKSFLSFIKTTLIRGLFLIIPTVLLLYLILKVVDIFRKIVGPIAEKIDFSLYGYEMGSRILAVVVLIILCFIVGLLAKTRKNYYIKDWVEDNILSNIPGYTLLKGMTEAAAGVDSKHLTEVVLVDFEEVWQIGFLMERIDDDLNTVFIPSAGNPTDGDVFIVKWERLRKLDIDDISVMKLYKKSGLSARKILEGKLNTSIFTNKIHEEITNLKPNIL